MHTVKNGCKQLSKIMHFSRRKLWKYLQQWLSTKGPLGSTLQIYLNLVILTILIKILKNAKTKMCYIKLATYFWGFIFTIAKVPDIQFK